MTYEEKEKLEQKLKYALDNIVSNIKGKTATEIIVCEQPMILLFQELMLNIESQSIRIQELKKENEKIRTARNWLIEHISAQVATPELFDRFVEENYVSKDKIKSKIEEFKTVRDTILENEKDFNRPMMTYDLKRNDYCEKMLQSLLEKE